MLQLVLAGYIKEKKEKDIDRRIKRLISLLIGIYICILGCHITWSLVSHIEQLSPSCCVKDGLIEHQGPQCEKILDFVVLSLSMFCMLVVFSRFKSDPCSTVIAQNRGMLNVFQKQWPCSSC